MPKLVIYHGSKDIIEKPYYHGGKAENPSSAVTLHKFRDF